MLLVVGWLVAARKSRLSWLPIALVATLGLASFVVAVLASGSSAGNSWLVGFYGPVGRSWEFAAGALIAFAWPHIPHFSRRAGLLVGSVGVIVLAIGLAILGPHTPFPGIWTLLPVGATVLLIVAGRHSGNAVTDALSAPVMGRIGDLSYSMYLWHWPFLVFAAVLWPSDPVVALLAALASVAIAAASYAWVEQPIRALELRTRASTALLVAIVVMVPLAAAGGLGLAARQGWGVDFVREQQAQARANHFGWFECMTARTMDGPGPTNPALCEIDQDADGPGIWLLGDSNAAQYSEAAVEASKALDLSLTITTAAACPFADIYRGVGPHRTASEIACREYYESTLAELEKEDPAVVVLGISGANWYDSSTIGSTADNGTADSDTKSLFLAEGITRTVSALQSVGHTVVLIQPLTILDGPSSPLAVDGCGMYEIISVGCQGDLALADVPVEQERPRQVIKSIAQETGARVIDIIDLQCPDGRCGNTYSGIPIYRDARHISVEFSRELGGLFTRALAAAGGQG